MRLALAASFLFLASGVTAQPADPLRGLSFGLGPASGLDGFAVYSDVRARLSLGPVLSVEPVLGLTGENGRIEVSPCLVPPCPEIRVDRRAEIAPGFALTLRVPESGLPGPLADAHLGVIGQAAMGEGPVQFRYGAEVGAAVQVARRLTLGLDLQAVRYAQREVGHETYAVERSSVVPLIRLGYVANAPSGGTPLAPEASARPGRRSGGVELSVSSGLATGFDGGAVQSEVRASLPLGTPGLAVEPAIGWTAAFGRLRPAPDCVAIDPAPGSGPFDCPNVYRTSGADAVLLGVGLATHSGRTRVLGVALADVHAGIQTALVSPTQTPNSYRVSLSTGASVPLARGVAVGGEVQASMYLEEAVSGDRAPITLAPMLRLVVGGDWR
ncbi:MAG: hypothetical protein AAFQ43_00600 [Bacteroidota bacterium]